MGRKKKTPAIPRNLGLATIKHALNVKPSKLPHKLFSKAPFYAPEFCPKLTAAENVEWRIHWHEKAMRDRGVQRVMRQAAFDDVLFWFNAFCWCFEPRARIKIKPFCTWTHQDPAIVSMDEAITDSERTESPVDLVVDKSRGQGATWMFLMVFLRRWLRDPMFSAGLVSKNEKSVDSAIDPDTLMWKIVWELGMLPFWMMPKGFDIKKHRNLSEHTLYNPEIASTIVGYAATGNVARGGRKTVFGMDELATFKSPEDERVMNNTQHITYCRFLVSTYDGDSGSYYDAATQVSNAIKVILDWKENPTCNHQLYRVLHGTIVEADPRPGNRLGPAHFEIISKQHERLVKRGYKIEDKLRNIWYNEQCLRPSATPRGIASELDRDPHGSVSKVFHSETLKAARAEYARPPLLQGNLIFDSETAEMRAPFITDSDSEAGDLKLWVKPDLRGEMPPGLFVLGADIAAGTAGDYSSNSVACVINKLTGEQVAEWASNCTIPARFAYVCAALGRWFHDAEIIPEANFAGSMIPKLVEDIVYPNVYYRETEIVGLEKKTQNPGFWMFDDNARLRLFEDMQEAMAEGRFMPRSEALLDECPEYQWDGNAKIVHVASTRTEDAGSKGKAHGDRVVAAALAWKLCEHTAAVNSDEEALEITPPEGCMADRLQIFDENNARNAAFADPWEASHVDIFNTPAVNLGIRDPWG